mmetsp:Transcript_46667/g.141392  ORF Transcript_46667/g.141392 Transcript_46667/m.141392 type:complete len:671 (-) Transcript_46667:139-2151(-)
MVHYSTAPESDTINVEDGCESQRRGAEASIPSWLRLKPMNSMDAYSCPEDDDFETDAPPDSRLGEAFSDEDDGGQTGSLEMTEIRSSTVSTEARAEDLSSGAPDENRSVSVTTSRRRKSGHHLPRHLSLFDLVSIGVGGTVGSGIFVLCGLIAREHAGPATCLSWAISGFAAFMSGFCYAELSGRIPSPGSSYSYAYACMGELVAFLTAACLSLEFLVSGSAVARSWGDKVVEWLTDELGAGGWVQRYLVPGYGVNPMACVVSAASTILVVCGVRESKLITDIFTWTKVGLVIFMAIGGLILLDPSNLNPFIPPMGFAGVMRGATTSFFGYLGYDGICAVAGEAKDPTINLPRSIMITLVIVTILYITAAVALTGMQHYSEIDGESGFPEAFKARGIEWAAQLTAAGEVFTLPVVVLISCILQPRLQFALARDGLAPKMFCEVDEKGNLKKGTIFAGLVMTLIATFVPFTYLDDFVSAGILVAFSVTNCSLVVMRRDSPIDRPMLLEKLLLSFNGLACLSCIFLVHGFASLLGKTIAVSLTVLTACVGCAISLLCPASVVFGGRRAVGAHWDEGVRYFRTPMVPFIPCIGTFVNWYLIAQLEILGIILLLLYFALSSALYFKYGAKNSRISGRPPSVARQYQEVHQEQENSGQEDQGKYVPCVENGHVIT